MVLSFLAATSSQSFFVVACNHVACDAIGINSYSRALLPYLVVLSGFYGFRKHIQVPARAQLFFIILIKRPVYVILLRRNTMKCTSLARRSHS